MGRRYGYEPPADEAGDETESTAQPELSDGLTAEPVADETTRADTVPAPAAGNHRVRLLKPHTHAGQQHDAGAEIDVSASAHAWLIKHGVVTSV